MAVFKFVLGSLPDRVKVYPTENYFYFQFFHRHIRYAGNIRLDVTDRDEGKVHFAYFEDLSEWTYYDESITHRILDATLRREGREGGPPRLPHLARRQVGAVRAQRPVQREAAPRRVRAGRGLSRDRSSTSSAMQFFLVFNKKLKVFHYVLNETGEVADQFVRSVPSDRILIGKRTGFAYYLDHKLDRKILIGVFEGNSRVNNYFDGPFDQLPDNFIEGNSLHDAIVAVEPHLKGKIDRYGITPGSSSRYMIGPYRHYRTEEDLMVFHSCATDKKVAAASYYACFVFDEDAGQVQARMRRGPANPGRKSR